MGVRTHVYMACLLSITDFNQNSDMTTNFSKAIACPPTDYPRNSETLPSCVPPHILRQRYQPQMIIKTKSLTLWTFGSK
jgi:hypothetical protein